MRTGLVLGLVLFAALAGSTARAQRAREDAPPALPVRFERLTPREGLSQGTIHAVLQDRRGFWWLATEDGLNRYDGHSFTIFRRAPFDTTSLSANIVRGLYEDAHGVLWVATEMGLDRMDPATGTFRTWGLVAKGAGDARRLSMGHVFDVTGDREGGIWVTIIEGGVSRLDPRTGRFEHFRHDNGRLPSDTAYVVYTDPAGQVWAGTKAGLSRFDARTRTFRPVALGRDLRAGVGAMLADAGAPHVFWLATTRGIVRFDTRT
ncbi:MAG TPA: two-component regulator propeller domain-containing protein, partial [Rhodothermales bacterium]|nr:two-component regulator propeller domain-containing protein [Rhodothermales bacterium]